jgi:hypothetical protein
LLGRKKILESNDLTTFSFLCSFHLGVIQGEKVEQHPSILSVHEGDHSVINCTYSDSASAYFPWYKQEHGKGPQLIIDLRSNRDTSNKDRLMVLLNKKDKHFSLYINGTRPGDSAVYFCAASTHCFPGTCNLSSNLPLRLQPHLCPLAQTIWHCI